MQSDRTEEPTAAPTEAHAAEPAGEDPGGLALELLVHGVGGATPEEMLDDPRTVRITGDATAAVYRRTEDVDAEDRPGEYADKPIPEGYCWSHLTSGNSARALWLILLPFMVVNLAHWMRPAAQARHRAVRLHGLVVRLVALSLTVLLAAAACEVALDLVAWQCAGQPGCAREHSWLGFMAVDAQGGGWWSQPGRRIALAALVPTALIVLLWWLSHRTWSAYESQPPWRGQVAEDDPAAADRPALCLPGFWYGRRLVARLRAAHTAAGLLTIAAALAGAATRFDRKPGGSAWLDALGWANAVLIMAGGLWALYAVCRRGRKESEADEGGDRLTVRVLPLASASVLVLAALHAGWSRPGWGSSGELPGDEAFSVIAIAQGALVVALAATGVVLHRAAPVARTALCGLAAASVAMLACALGGVMSGGVAQWVADRLGGQGIGPPTVLTWQASTIPVLLVLLLVLLCGLLVRVHLRSRQLAAQVHQGYPGARADTPRSRRIGRAIARAALTDSAPAVVGAVAVLTLLLGAAAVLGTWLTGKTPGAAADGAPLVVDGFADCVQALGSWLIGAVFLLFLALGRRAYKDVSARRTIGILWDVGTFWPRAAHPFAPPCYAERAVPDLVWRMASWTQEREGGRIVLSGHSQGSVLAAAAVWQLDPVTRHQVALLTYGSPLERLYGRWFPAYFGPRPLGALHRELDCWRNLWRLTDPIGGAVRLPGAEHPEVDRGPLQDPLAYGRTTRRPLPAPLLGHSDFQADPAFDEERDGLLARLLTRRHRAGAGEREEGGEPSPETLPAQLSEDAEGEGAPA
ncbi:hypothetical protein LHJ74_15740 [Streptomyces sp. N2-109]|uniref:Integral membrane protein n=1 Tax=Streptomyces gossypii TaxID=2883101 RepID=A0ABT2JUC7_9ACTN|nr:hypothetical protein [Streptomyces gossypii]MCT2591341.1 hypothetical protein [Streptomyces gossypii]